MILITKLSSSIFSEQQPQRKSNGCSKFLAQGFTKYSALVYNYEMYIFFNFVY